MRVLFAATLILGFGAALPARAQRSAPRPAEPQRIVLRDGRTWERVPLQYMDVRVLTAITGAPNLPTELDVLRLRYGGMMGAGMMGGVRGGYAGAYAGFPSGYGYGGPVNGFPGGGMSVPPFGGRTLLGDPNSNSLLVGPGSRRSSGGIAGPGGPGGRPAGSNRLFPGLIILGDPSTNSLIVDP